MEWLHMILVLGSIVLLVLFYLKILPRKYYIVGMFVVVCAIVAMGFYYYTDYSHVVTSTPMWVYVVGRIYGEMISFVICWVAFCVRDARN